MCHLWSRRKSLPPKAMPSLPRNRFVEKLLAELPSLLRGARRLTRTEADAEDLVQATVVRAIERQGDLRDDDKLRAWLLKVQRSVHLNSVRGLRARLEVIEGGEKAQEPQGDLEAEILDRTFEAKVKDALEALPDQLRDALLLREIEELSYEEIARIQGCPVGTVRSRLSRARLEVLERLSRPNEEEGTHGRLQPRLVR